jgi:hypothetical protein
MPKVPYPPGDEDLRDNNFNTCVPFTGSPLSIEFIDPGFIFPTATGIFYPDLPSGFFAAGDVIGPYDPVNKSTPTGLVVYFQDFKRGKMYTNTITIKAKC